VFDPDCIVCPYLKNPGSISKAYAAEVERMRCELSGLRPPVKEKKIKEKRKDERNKRTGRRNKEQ
jgi:hypothetical protein